MEIKFLIVNHWGMLYVTRITFKAKNMRTVGKIIMRLRESLYDFNRFKNNRKKKKKHVSFNLLCCFFVFINGLFGVCMK